MRVRPTCKSRSCEDKKKKKKKTITRETSDYRGRQTGPSPQDNWIHNKLDACSDDNYALLHRYYTLQGVRCTHGVRAPIYRVHTSRVI